MDLAFTDEQLTLRRVARRLFDARVTPSHLMTVRDLHSAFDSQLWREVTSLGWITILAPQPRGAGMSLEDAVAILYEAGRVLAPIPLASSVLANWLLSGASPSFSLSRAAAGVLDGTLKAAIVLDDLGALDGHAAVPVARLAADGQSVLLSTTRHIVRDAAVADVLLVPTLLGGETSIAVVDATAQGVQLIPRMTAGRLREAKVTMTNVSVAPSSIIGSVDYIALGLYAAVLEAAELTGCCEKLIEMTRTHAQGREQFGRPIATFQAVRHRLADMLTDFDCMLWAMFRVTAGPASQRIVRGAQQLQGGVGFVREHPLHMYFGRQKSYALGWGNEVAAADRLAAAVLDDPDGAGALAGSRIAR
jgi:acyl-CoA dehydrogenase